MKVLFAAGFSPIVPDLDASIAFYEQVLGITFDRDDNSDYVSTGDLDGLKHMGLWKLSDAAEACFGTRRRRRGRGTAGRRVCTRARPGDDAVGPADRARPVTRAAARRPHVYAGDAGNELISTEGTLRPFARAGAVLCRYPASKMFGPR